ncbi:AlbA family DNA-binding domain-containing protein [Embleya sp. NPDC055664]
MVFRSRRLEDLFGGAVADIGYADLVGLIGNADAAEAEDLDYKQAHYTAAPESREELAKDVAAFANHLGGVIVIGVAGARGVPSKAFDVELDDAHVRDLQQRIASSTAPPVRWEPFRKPNPADPGRGMLLLAVPRSPHGPHAVTAPPTKPTAAALRYPRRAGSKTDWLTETHVATAYHQRFQAAADRRERMREVQQDLVAEERTRDRPHLVVTLVPDVPGEMPINQRSFVAHEAALLAARPLLGLSQQPFLQVSVGRCRLRLDWPPPASRKDLAYLHDDGAGIWAHPVNTRVYTMDDDTSVRVVDADVLVHRLMSALAFLGAHARDRCGTTGTVNEVDLVDEMYSHPWAPPEPIARPGVPSREPAHPLVVEQRSGQSATFNAVSAQAEITALLDDLADAGPALVQATSALADRLLHTFGIPEAAPVTTDGHIRRAAWSKDLCDAIVTWAGRHCVEVV